jgi:hypothetical protein
MEKREKIFRTLFQQLPFRSNFAFSATLAAWEQVAKILGLRFALKREINAIERLSKETPSKV